MMREADNIFEQKWSDVLKIYKEDWKYNLKKHGVDALKYLPEHFYSEADVEAVLSCMLRNDLKKKTYYNSEYVVRNQLRFSPDDYGGFEISEKIKNMRKFIEKESIDKDTFIPDIVMDSLSGAKGGAFLLFAELTYQPGFNERYNEGIPGRIYNLMEKVEEEAKTLTAAIDSEVCVSGYICVISDDLVSVEGAVKLIEEVKSDYSEVNFLYDGMNLAEKLRILGTKR